MPMKINLTSSKTNFAIVLLFLAEKLGQKNGYLHSTIREKKRKRKRRRRKGKKEKGP